MVKAVDPDRTTRRKRSVAKRVLSPVVGIALFGCATGRGQIKPDLAPLPTTGVGVEITTTTPAPYSVVFDGFYQPKDTERPLTMNERDYISAVRRRAEVPRNKWEIIGWAMTWCDMMTRGMNRTELVAWIDNTATSDEQAWAWLVTAEASATYICADQQYKWNP